MEKTVFTGLKATEIETDKLSVPTNVTTLSKAVDYSLADGEKTDIALITLTAASKAVTLGLPDGQKMLVKNAGDTNAFTVKNVSGDSGTALAAGKVLLVVGSATANGSTVIAIN